MRSFDIDCTLEYEVQEPTDFVFHLEAAVSETQIVERERLSVTPDLRLRDFFDLATGNRFLRLHAKPGRLALRYRARVGVDLPEPRRNGAEHPIAALPDDTLRYLTPSRYCESDLLYRTAQRTFGHLPGGYARVQTITDWIAENIEYEIGSSNSATSARDVLTQRAGVCRDFAHLGIAFCRALNIPARLVVGYVQFDEPPQDFHAIFEAFVGGRWHRFDPTKLAPVENLVQIGCGADAKDVAFSTFYGQARMLRLDPQIHEVPDELTRRYANMLRFMRREPALRPA